MSEMDKMQVLTPYILRNLYPTYESKLVPLRILLLKWYKPTQLRRKEGGLFKFTMNLNRGPRLYNLKHTVEQGVIYPSMCKLPQSHDRSKPEHYK